MSFSTELLKISIIKKLSSLFPDKGKFRLIKLLYDYQSKNVRGINIVVPYLKEYNFRFLLNTKDIIGWKIFFFGEYEKSTNDLLRRFIKPGHYVIEAGANNGSETLLLSKLVQEGKVYAFEPVSHIYDRLEFNIKLNGLDGKIYRSMLALGDENKKIQFNIFPLDFENQGMSSKYGNNKLTSKIDVQQITLDTWVRENNIPKIDFLKMDIQGAEIDLIKGAKESIAKFKPLIFTEAADSWLNISTLFQLLKEMKYSIYLIEDKKFTLIKPEVEVKGGNWLAVPENSNLKI